MASSKVKTYFCFLPLLFWVVGGLGSFHCNNNLPLQWCCESTRQRPVLSQRGPRCFHPRAWHTLPAALTWLRPGEECARPRAWQTSSPTHFSYWSHSVLTMKLSSFSNNVHRLFSWHRSVFGSLYGNVWQRDHLFVACVRTLSISTETSCKAKWSGTFIQSTHGVYIRHRLIKSAFFSPSTAIWRWLRGQERLCTTQLWDLLAFG